MIRYNLFENLIKIYNYEDVHDILVYTGCLLSTQLYDF